MTSLCCYGNSDLDNIKRARDFGLSHARVCIWVSISCTTFPEVCQKCFPKKGKGFNSVIKNLKSGYWNKHATIALPVAHRQWSLKELWSCGKDQVQMSGE